MKVQNFRKLPDKTVEQGKRKLSRYISAPAWLAMVSADEDAMEKLQVEWERIFCPPPAPSPPSVEIPDSESQAKCRELFGADFFGIKETAGPYGFAFSERELEDRKSVRILGRDGAVLPEEQSWDLIRRCHEEEPGQFVCCAGVPHSVCDVHAKHPDVFHPDLRVSPWFAEPNQRAAWSDEKVPDFWFLLRKEVVPDSWGKSSVDQEIWLSKVHPHERFARPEHIVYADALCEKAHGLRLCCGDCWGRTLVRTAHGGLVNVRRGPLGLYVYDWNGEPGWYYGVPSLWTS